MSKPFPAVPVAVFLVAGPLAGAAAEPPPGAGAPEEAVMAADRALAAAVAAGDPEAFAALVAEDARFLARGELRGRAAVLEGWAPFFEEGGPLRLTWEPTEAVVAASGELAYSVGGSTLTAVAEDGSESATPGHYLTVWTREGDGPWRVAVDGPRAEDRDRFVAEGVEARSEVVPEAALTVAWRPERAVRAASDDLAYSLGDYRVELESPEGGEALEGRFLTVWRHGEGGWSPVAHSLTPPRPAASGR